jgi:hypothetical protein
MYIGNVNELAGKLAFEFFRPHLKAWWFPAALKKLKENDGEGADTVALNGRLSAWERERCWLLLHFY